MRLSPPISLSTFSKLPSDLLWVLQSEHWFEFGRAVWGGSSRNPIRTSVILLVGIVLLFMRRRIGAELQLTAGKVRRISTDRYAFTGKALFWTALLAVPFPLLIGFIGWTLGQADEPSEWLRGVNRGVPGAVFSVSVMAIISTICRPAGLGAAHFRWREDALKCLRRLSYWFGFVYVPFFLLTYCTLFAEKSRYLGGVGRISFIVANGWMAIVLARLLLSSEGILSTLAREYPNRLLIRLRYVWSILLIACPFALVLLACLGYMSSTLKLSSGFLVTAVILASGVFLYGLALRWFMIKHRKLALAEALERRRVRQDAVAAVGQSEESNNVITVDEEEQSLKLDSIDEQTRHLLRMLTGLGVAIAVFSFWSGIVPLIAALDAITIPMVGGLTLLGLSKAALIVVVAWIAVKNLPGMLELAILRATSIDAGTRNAITTLCQYGLIATGLVFLSNVLHLEWSKIGWMAAALSVGIGFGLQEVVANFVCGLILLFERPVRVGDVVTIDGDTGTVTKIHMRATTITNFDRGEVVFPNKTLITSKLMNWTLSASLNRILIPVGVGYGTDTEKARKILLEVAAHHAIVLDDPPPVATFEQFADSSLKLVLRAFLPDRINRDSTITELHTEIHKRFAAAGIEIPFPQRDVHVRNGSEFELPDGVGRSTELRSQDEGYQPFSEDGSPTRLK